MYTNLFKLCGWSDEEINANRSRIEFMLEKINCTDEKSLKHAEEHVSSCFDLSISAPILRIYLHEFLDIVNVRNEYDTYVTINFPITPTLFLGMLYAQMRTGKSVYVKSTTQTSIVCLGMIFDKYTRVLEEGERMGQGAGKAHCGQYQAEAGLLSLGILPKPDLVVGSGWFCDQAAEADHQMSQIFGFESVYFDGCMDWPWDVELPRENFEYSAKTVERAMKRVYEVTGLEITPEDNQQAWAAFYQLSFAFLNLCGTVGHSDPQVISHADLTPPYLFALVCPHPKRVGETLQAIGAMTEEVNRRIEQGIGILPKGAPKVYVGMKTGCDVRMIKVIEEVGLSITNIFLDGMTRAEKLPLMFPENDPFMQATEYMLKRPGLNTPCYQQQYHEDMLEEFGCDGSVLSYLYNCRPWTSPALMNRDNLEKKTGLPILLLETDYYDSRLYSPQQIKTRLEAYAEMLKLNKELKA
ncbi:2-hydroxyacyl-CoA dehydratase family protein [Dehalobacter sp. DCM]|uniref:2-hydroxyacyl-CoA dehydratase family protein n=1 Tax=Dehalobacter sp. DCM TaxID=2907827 RepID=UPI00308180BA|nr:2-hydroxyacyl-CoA dehydratase family protein [Dehalobacter sp. DCM]